MEELYDLATNHLQCLKLYKITDIVIYDGLHTQADGYINVAPPQGQQEL